MLVRDLRRGDVVEDKECQAAWVLLDVKARPDVFTLTWLRLDDPTGAAAPSDQTVSTWHDYGNMIKWLVRV